MKAKGREAMGSRKHGKSGHCGKSPKLRHHLRREAERNERRSKAPKLEYTNVSDLMKDRP